MLNLLITSFFFMLGYNASQLEEDDTPTLFVRTIVEKPTLAYGDSTLVSIVLYSDGAFADVQLTGGKELKGDGIRRVSGTSTHTAGSAIWQGRRYNTLIWAQYVVTSQKPRILKIPKQKFSATLRYRLVTSTPFGFMHRGRYKDVSAKCSSEPYSITFTEKPKRSTSKLVSSSPFAI